jgi:hypothetical protein
VSRSQLLLGTALLATCLIFGLPHLLIPYMLGPDRAYTPFAISGVSSVTYDKTATYAAMANYTALRFKPPYDTDVWETRDVPVPVTTAPFFVLAMLNAFAGGLDNVFRLCDFVLPPLAAFMLYLLLLEVTGSRRISLVGSFATILISFGPRNFLGVPLLLLSGQASSIVQPLEYSRLLHPELSFTLLATALLFLWRTLQRGRRREALLAGVVGGLLFYTYVYYFPIWLGACSLLLFGRRWLAGRAWLAVCLVNITTWVVSIPFWLSILKSSDTPNFSVRLARHYSEVGHIPPPDKLAYTFTYIVIFLLLATAFARFRHSSHTSAWKKRVLLFHACVFAAAIAAMNCEVVLGFNLEAMNHFPNRFFQPFLVLSAFGLLAPPATSLLAKCTSWWSARVARVASAVAIGALLGVALTRQTIVSINVADKHELQVEDRLLFEWLNSNTNLDDVVLTSSREINDLIPVFTHNLVFVPNGERTSAGDVEIERRFLVAMRLLQRPETEVHDLLAQDYTHGDPPLGLTYTYFLFVSGNNSYDLRLPESVLTPILANYRQLDLARELGERRLDYIYGRGSERPRPLHGWKFRRVYGNDYGTVWRVGRSP